MFERFTRPAIKTVAAPVLSRQKFHSHLVQNAPYTEPKQNEIVVKNRAVAINPIDWIMQVIGDIAFPWIKYPFVLGSDLAGDVVQVGTSVSRFKVGDRVLGHAAGCAKIETARRKARSRSTQ